MANPSFPSQGADTEPVPVPTPTVTNSLWGDGKSSASPSWPLKYIFTITQPTKKPSLHSACRGIIQKPWMMIGPAEASIWSCPAPSEQLQHIQDPQPQQQMCCKSCVRMAVKRAHRALPWTRPGVCPAVQSGSSHDPKGSPQTGSLSCWAATTWGHLLTEGWLQGTDHLEKQDVTVLYEHYPCCQCTVTSTQSHTEDLWRPS